MDSKELEGCLSFILIIALIFGCFVYNYFECHSKAEKQGYECSWGPLQGCMVKQKDGSWIDYDRLRIME